MIPPVMNTGVNRMKLWILPVLLLVAASTVAQAPSNLPDALQPSLARYEEGFCVATSTPPAAPVAAAAVTPAVKAVVPVAAAEPPLNKDVREVAALQIALDRRGFGSGLIDGQSGVKTRQALLDFRYVTTTGIAAAVARRQLLDDAAPVFVRYEVTTGDLAQVGDTPKDWEAAAALSAMNCRSLLEWLSEKFHASPSFVRQLNPGVTDWDRGLVGQRICVPNVRPDETKFDVRQITIDTQCFRLRGYDAKGRMVCSFPCSIARDRAKVPEGELRVSNVAPHPNYTFDPANFPESARAQQIGRKLILPPGPRNPVGVYWISLTLPGYGIHGTPHPETIGNMESHGCFRLCNWDAHTLGRGMFLGLPVLLDAPPRIFAK
jgi:lipoprotein-anchoring transpeptidase ErfK/SrfK